MVVDTYEPFRRVQIGGDVLDFAERLVLTGQFHNMRISSRGPCRLLSWTAGFMISCLTRSFYVMECIWKFKYINNLSFTL